MLRSLALLALVRSSSGGITASGADFTAASASPGNAFTAAADFNTVAVTVTDPGSPLRSTVTLASTAGSERGIATVRYQTAPAGTSHLDRRLHRLQRAASCSFDTTAVADGLRDVRAIATDTAGYTRTSATVASRRVDNTLPTVSLADPGAYLTGTKTLSATASDAGSGLAGLQIDYRPAGGSWTTACSGTTSPRSCALNTSLLIDGSYELRARATDAAGNVTDSASHPRGRQQRADRLGPGAHAAARHGRHLAHRRRRRRQRRRLGHRPVPPGGRLDLDRRLHRHERSVRLHRPRHDAVPRRPVRGAGDRRRQGGLQHHVRDRQRADRQHGADHGDAEQPGHLAVRQRLAQRHRGRRRLGHRHLDGPVPRLGRQHVDHGCSDTTASYGCSWATAGVTDGVYDLRAVATDQAGNTTASATRHPPVDNVAPTVTLTDPGTPLFGTVTLTANANDGGGIATVVFERSLAGANSWTTICTGSVADCAFDTTAVTVGNYDLRARVTDNAGRSTTSAIVAGRAIDRAPFGTAVADHERQWHDDRTARSRTTTISFTFSEAIAPASILSGWTGSSHDRHRAAQRQLQRGHARGLQRGRHSGEARLARVRGPCSCVPTTRRQPRASTATAVHDRQPGRGHSRQRSPPATTAVTPTGTDDDALGAVERASRDLAGNAASTDRP